MYLFLQNFPVCTKNDTELLNLHLIRAFIAQKRGRKEGILWFKSSQMSQKQRSYLRNSLRYSQVCKSMVANLYPLLPPDAKLIEKHDVTVFFYLGARRVVVLVNHAPVIKGSNEHDLTSTFLLPHFLWLRLTLMQPEGWFVFQKRIIVMDPRLISVLNHSCT